MLDVSFFALCSHNPHTYSRSIAKNCDNSKCPKIVLYEKFSAHFWLHWMAYASIACTYPLIRICGVGYARQKLIVSTHQHSTFAANSRQGQWNRLVHLLWNHIIVKFFFGQLRHSGFFGRTCSLERLQWPDHASHSPSLPFALSFSLSFSVNGTASSYGKLMNIPIWL